jgi:hypothetical protein
MNKIMITGSKNKINKLMIKSLIKKKFIKRKHTRIFQNNSLKILEMIKSIKHNRTKFKLIKKNIKIFSKIWDRYKVLKAKEFKITKI